MHQYPMRYDASQEIAYYYVKRIDGRAEELPLSEWIDGVNKSDVERSKVMFGIWNMLEITLRLQQELWAGSDGQGDQTYQFVF